MHYSGNSKDSAGIDRQVPESVDLEVSRRKRREQADLIKERSHVESAPLLGPDVGSQGYSSDLPLGTKLDYAVSCVEMFGQVLRNFTGSLPGERKLAILKSTYRLGLRVAAKLTSQIGRNGVVPFR